MAGIEKGSIWDRSIRPFLSQISFNPGGKKWVDGVGWVDAAPSYNRTTKWDPNQQAYRQVNPETYAGPLPQVSRPAINQASWPPDPYTDPNAVAQMQTLAGTQQPQLRVGRAPMQGSGLPSRSAARTNNAPRRQQFRQAAPQSMNTTGPYAGNAQGSVIGPDDEMVAGAAPGFANLPEMLAQSQRGPMSGLNVQSQRVPQGNRLTALLRAILPGV